MLIIYRDTLEEYSREVKNVSLKTLIFIAKALKMEVEDMKVLFDEGMQSMRMNFYPPCPQPEKVIGLSPHSDPLAITFLLQINEVEGLQIKKDGMWIPIKPLPDAFIINIGDILEVISDITHVYLYIPSNFQFYFHTLFSFDKRVLRDDI